MIYPALIVGFAVVVLLALVAFLVPVFENVFKDFGGELPAITKFTVGALALRHRPAGTSLIGVTVAVVFAFRKWKKSESGQSSGTASSCGSR